LCEEAKRAVFEVLGVAGITISMLFRFPARVKEQQADAALRPDFDA
jgi:hypothetical protein